jgi:hypothetical protein
MECAGSCDSSSAIAIHVGPFVGPDDILLSVATLLSYKLTYEITTVKRAARLDCRRPADDAIFYNVGVNEFPPARSIDRLESGLLSATGQP